MTTPSAETVLVDFFTKKYKRDRYLSKAGYSYDIEFDVKTLTAQAGHQPITRETKGYFNSEGKLVNGAPEHLPLDVDGKIFKRHDGAFGFYIGSSVMSKPLPQLVTLQSRGNDPERLFLLTPFGYLEIENPRPVAFLSNRRNDDKVYP